MQIDIPKTDAPRVVIVGGGFGGLSMAKALRKGNFQVVLVDKHNYHTFQPLLYQVATAALEPASISFPIRKIFHNTPNFYFRMSNVEKVDPENNQIVTDAGDLEYDHLVLATGAQTNYFGMEGLTISSMPMKSVLEALDLRSMILQNFEKALGIENERKKQSLMTFAIAGAGPTGVELAGALGEMKNHILPKDYPELDFTKMRVLLIQSGDRVLPALSEESSAKAKRYLEELDVEVILHTRVVDYFGDYIQTNVEQDYQARTLIWTTGVVGCPVGGIAPDSVHGRSRRMLVDEYSRINGHENIYAVGDCAAMVTEEFERGHPQVAPAAMQQGKQLAKNLINDQKSKAWEKFQYFDKGAMATIGKNRAVVELGKMKMGGFMAWFVWMFVHLMSLVGFRNRVVVFFDWTRNYFNHDRGARIILEHFDLSEEKKKRKKEWMEQSEQAEA